MVNYQLIGMFEGAIVLIADLLAFGLILRVYLKNRRKSALYLSLTWLFDFLLVLTYNAGNPYIASILVILVSILFFLGSINLIWEENNGLQLDPTKISKFLALALALTIYTVLVDYTADSKATGFASLLSSHSVAAFFFVIAGLQIGEIEEIYGKKIAYLKGALILFGLHLLPIPLIYINPSEVYPLIGYGISMVLIVMLTSLTIKLASSEQFLKLKTMEIHEVEIEPGVKIINSEKYKRIKEKLKDAPVLAFVRTLTNIPETWTYYFVTTATKESGVEAIPPTNLEKMTELSYKYLKAIEEAGGRGIIIIDCLEYLVMYNEFTSVIKFLNRLKDFVVSHKGTLILVAEKEAFEDQQWALLTRLLEENE
ncbi:DUF835 domain-containing protein [Thermococcus aggregans]|uniref:DUF835 domain-containing protein n=1 Tax=Thermococcus aggregans TaxID=110163 RepID=A0A9E7SNF6_THEAG|nr:DUF835 domain-containing protein [Thermococcus aggregans]USS40316.1 DUF835 domain-containing protein [Thermococcus aggregans]